MILGLQFLRFLAAALVVLNHSMGAVAGTVAYGAVGVDIFFVLSGFIISHITETSRGHFLARRLIRIAPQYWLVTAALAVLAYAAPQLLNNARFDVGHIAASLSFVPYWTPTTKFSPLLQLGWTLNFEMFFYVMFLLAMKVSVRHRELVCAGLLALVFALLWIFNPDPTSPLAFYKNSIIFEFLLGMSLAVLFRHGRIRQGGMASLAVASALFFAVTYAITYALGKTGVPRFVLWGLPAFALVWVVLSTEVVFQRLPAPLKAWVVTAGDVSYPLYLTHLYFTALLARILGGLHLGWPSIFLIALTGSCATSLLVLRLFDEPIRARLLAAVRRRAATRRMGWA